MDRPLDAREHKRLLAVSLRARERVIRTVFRAGSGHVGAALSQCDVLVSLYERHLRLDPAKLDDPTRDRFVLSKGHGGLGLAAVLAERGILSDAELDTFGESASPIGMHMDHRKVRGVETATGSLGHGLGIAVGMALGARIQRWPTRVFCLLSDGECYEGSTWEAALSASASKLASLCAIVDRNRLTMDGFTEREVPLEPLADKWKSFGWSVSVCDGHDFVALDERLSRAKDRGPSVIIAETVKGKGVSFMENKPEWHYGAIDSAKLDEALLSLRAQHDAAVQASGARGES